VARPGRARLPTWAAVAVLAAVAALPFLFPAQTGPRQGAPAAGAAGERTARVERVIDGDSLRLASGEDVRLIGVDCPERGEPFHDEASSRTRSLVLGREVVIELDREARDRYGRLLAYVHSGKDRLVNETLVREGLASCYEVPPNVKHAARLRAAQDTARRERRGIWSAEPVAEGDVVASRSGRFHRPGCPAVASIRDPVRYTARDAALDAGLSPCRNCKP